MDSLHVECALQFRECFVLFWFFRPSIHPSIHLQKVLVGVVLDPKLSQEHREWGRILHIGCQSITKYHEHTFIPTACFLGKWEKTYYKNASQLVPQDIPHQSYQYTKNDQSQCKRRTGKQNSIQWPNSTAGRNMNVFHIDVKNCWERWTLEQWEEGKQCTGSILLQAIKDQWD